MRPTQQYFNHPTGPVEYLVAGEGQPVLCVHGTGVSNETVLKIESRMLEEGFQLIVPHRPGYYGTPLGTRTTPQAAADLYSALLDHLGHSVVKVVGTSGGGPSSICFAQQFPDRVERMVLQCPVTHYWDDPEWIPAPDRWSFPLLKRAWLRKAVRPLYRYLATKNSGKRDRWLPRLAGERYEEIKDDPATLELAEVLMAASLDALQHPAGMHNDIDIFCRSSWTEPAKITCPLLLLHDSGDTFVPYRHSGWLHSQVAHSELQSLHCAGHLLWSGAEVQRFGDLRRDFLCS
ncbi:MAG: alpha/beta hydrolase [Planctomycetaceae bacterium]|nr:alpha/beta hydrolase [Planctomycetaceae bacterium]